MEGILEAKSARWAKRISLAEALSPGSSLVTLTLRLPAALRVSELWRDRGRVLFDALAARAENAGLAPLSREFRQSADGPEGYLVVPARARRAKELALDFEEGEDWGALVDADIMGSGGSVYGREELGLEPRSCLVCGAQGSLCAVEKRHSTEEISARAEALWKRFCHKNAAEAGSDHRGSAGMQGGAEPR